VTSPASPSGSTVQLRALEARDRAQWDVLWAGYLAFYEHDLPADITDHLWRRLLDPGDQPYGFVAVDSGTGQLVGFVHYHFHLSTWSVEGYCYLEDLFVAPSARGKGAGRMLIEAVYRAASARGASRVYWHTQATNTDARALYDKVAELTEFVQYRRPGT
jgi:GNAT superfamily N-acetyltransferase